LDYWGEYASFVFIVLGFIFAVSARSAGVLYLLAFLFGGMSGRWWWKFKKNPRVAPAIIIIGFLIGFVVGSFYGSRQIVVIAFALGMGTSYLLHDKGIIHSAEY